MKILENDTWSIRNSEVFSAEVREILPSDDFLLMLRSVNLPPGPYHEARQGDGKPVESCAILCCIKTNGKWQWQQLSAVTKEYLGDILFDHYKCPRDIWIPCKISQPSEK